MCLSLSEERKNENKLGKVFENIIKESKNRVKMR